MQAGKRAICAGPGNPPVLVDDTACMKRAARAITQGAAYGDDAQAATNYPLVRLTNRVTGNVYYARTTNPSTMGIAYTGVASTNFVVSSKTETGLSNLQVVVNGLASAPVTVNIQ